MNYNQLPDNILYDLGDYLCPDYSDRKDIQALLNGDKKITYFWDEHFFSKVETILFSTDKVYIAGRLGLGRDVTYKAEQRIKKTMTQLLPEGTDVLGYNIS